MGFGYWVIRKIGNGVIRKLGKALIVNNLY